MPTNQDGPVSSRFSPLLLRGNVSLHTLAHDSLQDAGLSAGMAEAAAQSPQGTCVAWGIPFEIGDAVLLAGSPVSVDFSPAHACLAGLFAYR